MALASGFSAQPPSLLLGITTGNGSLGHGRTELDHQIVLTPDRLLAKIIPLYMDELHQELAQAFRYHFVFTEYWLD
jgi:hypothetical protein